MDPNLQTFSFLPASGPSGRGRTSVLSVFRDNRTIIEETGVSPIIASGRQGDVSTSIDTRVTLLEPVERIPRVACANTSLVLGPTGHTQNQLLQVAKPRDTSERPNHSQSSQRPNLNIRNLSLDQVALKTDARRSSAPWLQISTDIGSPMRWKRVVNGPADQLPHQARGTSLVGERMAAASRPVSPTTQIDQPFDHADAGVNAAATAMGPQWNELLGMDISEAMRRKALLDFGLEFSLNDAIETRIPTTNGFIFEWFDRFLRLMGRPEMRAVEEYDFTLQGVCGIWNGQTVRSEQQGKAAGKDRHSGNDAFSYSKAARRGTGNEAAMDPNYISAMESIMRQAPEDFLDPVLFVDTAKRAHRKFMLAICGELTGQRLEAEILR